MSHPIGNTPLIDVIWQWFEIVIYPETVYYACTSLSVLDILFLGSIYGRGSVDDRNASRNSKYNTLVYCPTLLINKSLSSQLVSIPIPFLCHCQNNTDT